MITDVVFITGSEEGRRSRRAVDFFTAVWEDGALEEVVVEPKKVKSQG